MFSSRSFPVLVALAVVSSACTTTPSVSSTVPPPQPTATSQPVSPTLEPTPSPLPPTSTPAPTLTRAARQIDLSTFHLGWVWPEPGLRVWGQFAVGLDGTLYLTDEKSTLHALTPSRKELWTYHGDYERAGPPVLSYDGKVLYIVTGGLGVAAVGKDELYAVGTDGKLRWKYSPAKGILSLPVVAPDGTVYLDGLGEDYRVSPDGKAELFSWSEHFGPESAAFDRQGRLYARDWEQVQVYSPQGKQQNICPIQDLAGALVGGLGASFVYKTTKGDLVASDPQCKQLWRYSIAADKSGLWDVVTTATDGTVYAATENGEIHALSADGKPLWKSAAADVPGGVLYLATGPEGVLFVVSKIGELAAFDDRGGRVWADVLYDYGTPGQPQHISGGGLAIVNANRLLYFTSDPAMTFANSTPVAPPTDAQQAEEEIRAFMLDYIVKKMTNPEVANIIIWGKADAPKRVWWYEGEKLTERPDMKEAIADYRKRYIETDDPWNASYGFIEFSVKSIDQDRRQAVAYVGAMWGHLFGRGIEYRLHRRPDGHWWFTDQKTVWVS